MSEDDQSEEEYIPDSESEDNDEDKDLDASVSFRSSLSRVAPHTLLNLKMCLKQTSQTSIPVSPCKTECQPSTLPNSKLLESDLKAKTDCHQNDSVQMSSKRYCYICGKAQSKISWHLETHKTHAELVHAFSLPENSKQRKRLLEKMRNKGNFLHNQAVLQTGTCQLKVKR